MTTRINVASIAVAHGPRGVARIGRHAPLSETSDAFGALAPLFRVRPELQVLCRFGAQWASPHDPEPAGWMPFHMVVAGHCHLGIAGDPPLVLHAGDVVLLPFGDAHTVMGSTPAPRAASPPIRTQPHGAIAIKSNVEAPEVELVCGRLAFEQAHGNLARAALPRVIHVKTAGDPAGARLSTLLLAIRDELSEARAGAAPICRDLASALFLIVLRSHFETHPVRAGLLRLLESRQASRAVAAMLAQPARAWTLDEIAATAQTSRATLVRDFRRLAQATPFDILAYLRLGLARHQLATSRRPIAEIAVEVGYQSQSAFSRAFQRRFDMSPSEVRQKALTTGGRPALRRKSLAPGTALALTGVANSPELSLSSAHGISPMTVSSPSKLRLPHASAGPLWCPLPAVETHGWQEIETLLSAPTLDLAPSPPRRRGIGSFALVAAALVMGCGVLATTLIPGRGDCGDACHVVTASTGPTGEPAAAAPPGTDVASRSDRLAEGRSVADGADAAKPDTPGAEASTLPPPRRHHHHRRHSYVEP